MHEHSRWIVAATAAVLGAALAAPAADARTHRHGRSTMHTARPAGQRLAPAAPPMAEEPPTSTAPPASAVPPATDKPTSARAEPQADHSAYGKSGTPAIVLGTNAVQAVLGKIVRSSTGDDMGRLVDVVVDHDGQPRAAIIDFGGFLGVGSRKIAVDWGVLNFSRAADKAADKGVITAELTRDQVKSAPEFKEGNPVVVLGAMASPPATAPPQGQEK